MSASARSSNDSTSSWSRRRSLFGLPALKLPSATHHHVADDAHAKVKSLTKKKQNHARSPSAETPSHVTNDDPTKSRPLSDQPTTKSNARRPSLSMKVAKRPPLVFESLKNSVKASSEELMSFGYANGEPLSTTSSKAPSLSFENAIDGASPAKTVLMHGEVQTSAGMFRKKREYLVLTELYIIRYKSQAKAAETFKSIPHPVGRPSPTIRHGSMPSVGSQSDLQTLSESSGDKHGRVPIRQVVAIQRLDDGKPYFALEVSYLDEESAQASSMTLQFNNPEDRDVWLRCIRSAVHEYRSRQQSQISAFNLENAARIVERDNDYDPYNCSVFKVVQRQAPLKAVSRSSSDDLTKVASTVCFLAIGVHKCHLIQVARPVTRSSSPSLSSNNSQSSYGILTLTSIKVSSFDDSLEVTFRAPLQKPRTLYLASSASHEIAARLHYSENFLRPECGHRLFRFVAPPEVEDLLPLPAASDVEEHSCLDRTLIAYCVAYGVNPTNVRYTINYNCEDGPCFELLPPADPRRPNYGPLELLAIMRALRYNESFGSLSFANITLDSLNGLHDNYGQEHVCSKTKRGTSIRLSTAELSRSSLLVQEIRALAATSKRLRRMDFSGTITTKHTAREVPGDETSRMKDIGCGIVEALFPLCKHQTTNVDWICLNGIDLSDTDLDYLVGAAVDKSCHFRAIELNRCGLSDRSLGLILDALRAQENTMESLEIAGNAARLNPAAFDSQLGIFGFIRKLNLSNVSRTSGTEPFLQAETLLIWRLQELRLSGTTLNAATVEAISTYLAHPQSASLHELFVDHTYLSGADVAVLLNSLAWDKNEPRNMHLDISQALLSKGLEQVTEAITNGFTPSHLSMRAIEYREEPQFRKVISALTGNKTLRFLDMSQTALPGDASEDTCRALSKLLAENSTLLELDLSGDDSRLASSKFGAGINDAIAGLKHNKTMQTFRIEKQKLGFQGASTLAEVLRENRALLELHCDNNEIPLHGLTDLVNSLVDNTTLVFLPAMNDGRTAAFKAAEATMKVMADVDSPTSPTSSKSGSFSSGSVMRRGIANIKKTTNRTSSAHTPSMQAMSSHGPRSFASSGHRSASPLPLTALPPMKAKHSPSSSMSSPPTGFTVQDVQTTHFLLTEQWDRQCSRLERLLNRNWCLLNDVPCEVEAEDEHTHRPSSVGSIGKMLERVKYDTTPRAEKSQYFESPQDVDDEADLPATHHAVKPSAVTSVEGEKHGVSFKHFILESGPATPGAEVRDIEGNMRQMRIDTNMDGFDEPRTPTQQAFTTTT